MNIELLNTQYHRLDLFSCQNNQLDDVLHNYIFLAGCGRTRVVVPSSKSTEVLACFTLQPDIQDMFSEDGLRQDYNAVLLNILAVDYRYQNQGVGKAILLRIIRDIVQISETVQIDYLLVKALDDAARGYYLHTRFGFVLLPDGEYLRLSIDAMRQYLENMVG